MCPKTIQEGEVAVFKLALNHFLKGTSGASCAQSKERQDLGSAALNLGPGPEAQYGSSPVMPQCRDRFCVMRIPQLSTDI